jgi:hypothetical protein
MAASWRWIQEEVRGRGFPFTTRVVWARSLT